MLTDIIAWAALLFSGIALILHYRTYRQQSRLTEKQLAEHSRAARERVQADVTVALVQQDSWAGRGTDYKIVIANNGPSEARDVNLIFPDGKSPLASNEDRVPVKVLQPGGSVSMPAAVMVGCRPPFGAVLRWKDGSGDRTREATLA